MPREKIPGLDFKPLSEIDDDTTAPAATWLEAALPQLAASLAPEQRAALDQQLAEHTRALVAGARIEADIAARANAAAARSKEDAFRTGYAQAVAEYAPDRVALKLASSTASDTVKHAMHAEQSRWCAALGAVAAGDKRLEFAVRLLAATDLPGAEIASLAEALPARTATADRFAAVMRHFEAGATQDAAASEPVPLTGQASTEQRAAFGAQFRGMRSAAWGGAASIPAFTALGFSAAS